MPHKDPVRAKQYAAAYRAAHKEAAKSYATGYSKAHSAEAVKRAAKWRKDNPEQFQKWMAANRGRYVQRAKEKRIKNRQGYRACRRSNYRRNREKILSQRAAYRERNHEKIRSNNPKWRRKWEATHRPQVREKAMRRYALKRSATVGEVSVIRAFYKHVQSSPRLRCYWCKKATARSDRHVDHIVPLSKGGAHAVENLCCACVNCNESKGAKLPQEFGRQHWLELVPVMPATKGR